MDDTLVQLLVSNDKAANEAPVRDPEVWDHRIPDFNPLFGHTPEAEPIALSPTLAKHIAEASFSFDDYLAQERTKGLLRFFTAGSVDDGKSTLIGRLLYDTQSVYDDQLRSIEGKGTTAPGVLDLALLTDGLRAEREQGITIDVAYRYFSTARRKFIIADTPGHEQYTRNMATGASTASLAIVLLDARKGVLLQSRRHAAIIALLGVPQIVVAINKMDLVDFSEQVFDQIRKDFTAFFTDLSQAGLSADATEFQSNELGGGGGIRSDELGGSVGLQPHETTPRSDRGFSPGSRLHFIPVSALNGDNITTPSPQTPWYPGPTLLDLLETLPTQEAANDAPFRMPIQRVVRPSLDFRGFAGQIAAGQIRPGDEVMSLPSGRTSRVRDIVTFDGNLPHAHAPQSITLTLEDELDISRGDLLVGVQTPATITARFTASLVWMDAEPLALDRRYLLRHTTRTVNARIAAIRHRLDIVTLAHDPATTLELNSIGLVEIETTQPLCVDRYTANRHTGSFLLIDPATNATAAAGMIRETSSAPRHTDFTATLLLDDDEHQVPTVDALLRLLTERGLLKGTPTR